MSGQFTPEERAKVISLNEQLMEDATGAAVVIVGLESDKNALLVANQHLAAALKRLLDALPSATTHPAIVEAVAALREAGYES